MYISEFLRLNHFWRNDYPLLWGVFCSIHEVDSLYINSPPLDLLRDGNQTHVQMLPSLPPRLCTNALNKRVVKKKKITTLPQIDFLLNILQNDQTVWGHNMALSQLVDVPDRIKLVTNTVWNITELKRIIETRFRRLHQMDLVRSICKE